MRPVKIKNRTQHAIILYSADGESVQVNSLAVVTVDSRFLIDYDRTKIQILSPETKPIVTEVKVKEISSDIAAEETLTASKKKKS